MSLAARILVARAQAAGRKAARRRRTELKRELAGYAASAGRGDFEAILDRYPRGTTHELRSILAGRPWPGTRRASPRSAAAKIAATKIAV